MLRPSSGCGERARRVATSTSAGLIDFLLLSLPLPGSTRPDPALSRWREQLDRLAPGVIDVACRD
jgi:hypothetical protein